MASETITTAVQTLELPGDAVFPESIGVDPAIGDAYVGSLADGALYRLAGGEVEVWSPAGADQRKSVAGSRWTPGAGCGPPADTRGRCTRPGTSGGLPDEPRAPVAGDA
jgi:hypothetical protein